MKISWLVALRELAERIKTRSFITMAIIGPVFVLLIAYLLFVVGMRVRFYHSSVLIFLGDYIPPV
jgi:ABC-type Na+ efflux pump permease subunit